MMRQTIAGRTTAARRFTVRLLLLASIATVGLVTMSRLHPLSWAHGDPKLLRTDTYYSIELHGSKCELLASRLNMIPLSPEQAQWSWGIRSYLRGTHNTKEIGLGIKRSTDERPIPGRFRRQPPSLAFNERTSTIVPSWILLTSVVFVACGCVVSITRDRTRLRMVRAQQSACIECGYSLVGNISGICPECGSSISCSLHS